MLKNVSITNNDMAGLTTYHTALVVNGTSIFHNNIGTDGDGTKAPISHFRNIFDPNFTNNSAMGRGGAILVDTCNQVKKAPCFFPIL